EFYRTYMGGSAFGIYYLLHEMPAGADPLGPDNVLTFMLSPLTGAPFSGQSRVAINARSPLSEAIGDSQAGGFWPAQLKFAGFDGVVIKGKAEKPVYLWIHDGEAELGDASHLWGMGSWDTETTLRRELKDEKIEVACIGPAGENLVRFAAVMNMRNRAAGRTGMGAVMGAKSLKAVAVRGDAQPALADPSEVRRIARQGAQNLKETPDMDYLAIHGTAGTIMAQQMVGGLPTHNFTSGVFEGAEAISGERMTETILKRRDTCYACVVRCKRVVEAESEEYGRIPPELGGPEYETLSTLGSYCDVEDLLAVAKGNALCNNYGLDTISTGATIAWAMECYEAGLLTPEQTDGIDLRFGNGQAIVEAIERIAHRQGFLGNLLAEGSARAAEQLGRGSEAFLVVAKKHEVPAHMPQLKHSLGLIYSVNPFGADHQSSEHDPMYEPGPSDSLYLRRLAELGLTAPRPSSDLGSEKVRFARLTQFVYSLMDTLCLCQFDWGPAWQLYGPTPLVEVVRAVTGWDVDLNELLEAGERRVNLLRAFNAREGFDRSQDQLSPRLFEPLWGGISDGLRFTREELAAAQDEYYRQMGWDPISGNPTKETLERLKLGWVAEMAK
ncbi:MAG TPA: aldehyde:ferredoxin oxidoreductase, partial [Anaerolineae bacterium]|nr:aldehyde:ferredoxin oxidoreductase [Anaerolineae bacterium]